MRLVLRSARLGVSDRIADVALEGGRVAAIGEPGRIERADREADLASAVVLPGLVNAHDHLDFSTFPALGTPPYPSVYAWARDVDAGFGDPRVKRALAMPLADRLFLGGVRNLLAGVSAVAHHGAFHRSLARDDFPVRVLERYGFAHSPGLTPELRKTYRSSDRRIPWLVHAGEGTDPALAAELAALAEANVLRHNTVIAHGIAFGAPEIQRIAEAKACLVWCPESNRHLYGATASPDRYREQGVRVGLGSDSPVSGVRDPLSNLACAAATSGWDAAALFELASGASAEVARLPVGGFSVGAPADFLVTRSVEALLRGERLAVGLVIVAGKARYGEPRWLLSLRVPAAKLEVDGEPRALAEPVASRAISLLRSGPRLEAAWLQGLRGMRT